MEAPLHERLWARNADLARACLDHPFVRGLARGDLDLESFKRYVAQDAFFLRAFLGAYALAAARCSAAGRRLDVVRRFHTLIGGALDELDLHAGYAADLGVELEGVRPYPATSAYTDFLLRTAFSAEVGEIVAAMTPCMRLYAYLGRQLASASGDGTANPYREWIETYSSAEFESLAAEIESLLDELACEGRSVHEAYRYAMRCELDFFSAPLTDDPFSAGDFEAAQAAPQWRRVCAGR